MKKILAVLSAVVVLLGLTGCKNNSDLDDILANGKLIMATNAEFPPYEFIKGGEIVGIDIDIANEFSKELGVKLEIINTTFDGALLSGQNGSAHIVMAGLTVSDKRKENFDFTNTYAEANQKLLVKKDSLISGTTVEEIEALLNNKIVGVQLGTVSQYYVEGSEDWDFVGIKGAKCKTFTNSILAAEELNNGKIDAVMVDSTPGGEIVKMYEDLILLDVNFTEESYAIATKKGNTALVEKLNEILEKLKNEGKLNEIFAKFA